MKTGTVNKRIKTLKNMLYEQGIVKATIKCMEKDEKENILDMTPEQKQYLTNLKKRLVSIENGFNNILK
jgi:hypothetical protein